MKYLALLALCTLTACAKPPMANPPPIEDETQPITPDAPPSGPRTPVPLTEAVAVTPEGCTVYLVQYGGRLVIVCHTPYTGGATQ